MPDPAPKPTPPPKPRRSLPVRTIQRVLGGLPLDGGSRSEDVPPGVLRTIFHMVHLLLVGIRRSDLTRMAAALSYRTMFGLIPVVVVVAVALAAFTSQSTQQTVIRQMLVYAGLDRIRIEIPGQSAPAPAPNGVQPGAAGPGAPTDPSPADAAPQAATNGVKPTNGGDAAPALDEWINEKAVDIASRIKQMPFNLIGLIAILTLLYAAISMLVEVERAFNDIYRAPEGRGWVRRVVQYWTLLTLGPILLIASFTITHYLTDSARELASIGGETLKFTLMHIVRFCTAAGVTTVLLIVIYTSVPNTRVQITPAALGALVAGCLWELGKLGFTRYVEFATRPGPGANYANLYGAVAILPLFLIWVYVSWMIILFGLQLAASMQTYQQATARGLTRSVLATLGLIEDHAGVRTRFVDPAGILGVVAVVAQRFREGRATDHNHASERTGIDEQVIDEMLEKLAAAGLIHRLAESGDRLTAYTLSRPPETIAAFDVLRLGEELAGFRSDQRRVDPHTRAILDPVERARAEALAGKTLADLLPPAPAGPSHDGAGTPVPAA